MKEHTELQHHLHPLHLWTKCGGRGKRFWKVYENHIWKRLRPKLGRNHEKEEKQKEKGKGGSASSTQRQNASVW